MKECSALKQTVLVTGASRGIGFATARLFAGNGHPVAINYNRTAEPALRLAREINASGGMAVAVRADVSDRREVERMTELVREQLGPIEILVNNAAISGQSLFEEIDYGEWQRTFAVNVDGVFHCSQLVLPDMLRRHSGAIVNISSMWGQTGASCEVLYSATKAAVIGLTRALAMEVAPNGIRVNCVAPGVVDTDMNRRLGGEAMEALRLETPMLRLGTPEDIANAVYFLSSDKASFITGQVIAPNGGYII